METGEMLSLSIKTKLATLKLCQRTFDCLYCFCFIAFVKAKLHDLNKQEKNRKTEKYSESSLGQNSKSNSII
jgi:hypothetical protein